MLPHGAQPGPRLLRARRLRRRRARSDRRQGQVAAMEARKPRRGRCGRGATLLRAALDGSAPSPRPPGAPRRMKLVTYSPLPTGPARPGLLLDAKRIVDIPAALGASDATTTMLGI